MYPRGKPFLIYTSDLPETARNIVRLVGLEAALALIREFGGVTFPFPLGADSNASGAARFASLEDVVGHHAAMRMLTEYAGEDLYIPNCKQAVSSARRRAMIDDYTKGFSIEQVAMAYRVTERWVSNELKAPFDTGHGDAFEYPSCRVIYTDEGGGP